jgi:RNA polymerase sigma-70 factor (ECF subfamily)
MEGDRPGDLIAEKYEAYGSMLYRLCFVLLCSRSDAEDAVQDAFVKYLRNPRGFESAAHEKAWFLRVAANVCRDRQRFRFRHGAAPLEEAERRAAAEGDASVLRELLSLPVKCKVPLYLHYIEGYSLREIAKMLKVSESAVKSRLFRGRQMLRLELSEGRDNREGGRTAARGRVHRAR